MKIGRRPVTWDWYRGGISQPEGGGLWVHSPFLVIRFGSSRFLLLAPLARPHSPRKRGRAWPRFGSTRLRRLFKKLSNNTPDPCFARPLSAYLSQRREFAPPVCLRLRIVFADSATALLFSVEESRGLRATPREPPPWMVLVGGRRNARWDRTANLRRG